MGVFKNEVGRPSNEVKKKRLIIKIVLGVLLLGVAFALAYLVSNNLNKTEDSQEENENKVTTTVPSTTIPTTTTVAPEKEENNNKILNIYGHYDNNFYRPNEKNDSYFYIRDEVSEEDKTNYKFELLGTYECKNEDCILFPQQSFDLTSVVIKDGDYLAYNFKTKKTNKIMLDEYKDKLNYLEEDLDYMCEGLARKCIYSLKQGDKTYYEFVTQGDVDYKNILIGPDYKPVFVITDDEIEGESYWDKAAKYLTYLDNNKVVYLKDNKIYTYDSKTNKIKLSKEYKDAVLISKQYVVVVDTDAYLKVLDFNGNIKAKLTKITDNMLVHDVLSGWYEENKKEGIYVVVANPNVKYEELSEKLKNELGSDYSGMELGYEHYYIPSTGEIGKIATYIGGYAKPVLYLYPKKDNTKVTVSFAKPGLLTTTYPKFKNSWEVTANKNGDLYDKNNKYYYGLYWEENGSIKVDFNTGFYVTKENAIKFLEEKLSIIGLNDKERNEFIMYWLPILERNEKSLVYFELTESREAYNKLIINPKPDSLLRMAIHIKKVDEKVNIKEQKLTSFERKGFSAVEWGGVIH